MLNRSRIISVIEDKVSLDEAYFTARLKTASGKRQMFHDGWGDQRCLDYVDSVWDSTEDPAPLEINWREHRRYKGDLLVSRGNFPSTKYFDWLPAEARMAEMLFIRPQHMEIKRAVLIAPTSRESGYNLRTAMAYSLAKAGVACALIDNPFMGKRKPIEQFHSVIGKFSDYPLLAGACVEENRMVLNWLRQLGAHTICATGVSQGGFTAAAAALRLPFEIGVVSVVPPNSAEQVVAEGIPGRLCAWDSLNATCPTLGNAKLDMRKVFQRTRLDRIPVPAHQNKIHLIAAHRDRFIPAVSYQELAQHWKDVAIVEWSPGSHLATILDRDRHLRAVKSMLLR